mgnify:CR=1 FL=1
MVEPFYSRSSKLAFSVSDIIPNLCTQLLSLSYKTAEKFVLQVQVIHSSVLILFLITRCYATREVLRHIHDSKASCYATERDAAFVHCQ